MPFPRAILVFAGCLGSGFFVAAVGAHVYRGVWLQVLTGIFLLTIVSFFASMWYLAPKYGRKVGRTYQFDNDSPMAFYIPLGIVTFCLEGGIVYCIGRHIF